MGRRGPKPTPTAILQARGSWRANANPAEPMPPKGSPSVPSEVRADPDAMRTWRRVLPKLEGAGVITPLDGEALGHYCMLHAMRDRAHRALRDLRSANPGKPVEQTETGQKIVRQVLDIGRAMKSIEAEFGMTPSARSRIVLPSDRTKDAKNKDAYSPAAKTAISFVRQAG